MVRSFRTGLILLPVLVLSAVLWACIADSPLDPTMPAKEARLRLYANVAATRVDAFVIEVTGPGIESPLSFRVGVENGMASGSFALPIGADRTVTIHAYDANMIETHRGSTTLDVQAGTNETVSFSLLSLNGAEPLEVSVGSIVVVIQNATDHLMVGDTLRLSAIILDAEGDTIPGTISWYTLDPELAVVDAQGLVTARAPGEARIVAGQKGVAAMAATMVQSPGDYVETLLAGLYYTWWGANHSYSGPALPLSVMAWGHTSSHTNQGMWQMSRYPREAWDNDPTWRYALAIEFAWTQSYAILQDAARALRLIEDGVDLGGEEARARAYAKFMQGLAHGTLALLYDRAVILDERTGAEGERQLRHYLDVKDAALGYLTEAIELSILHEFALPYTWIHGRPLSNDQFARLARSYMARFEAEVARTPAERAAADWPRIIFNVDYGITEDFTVLMDGAEWVDELKYYGAIYQDWAQASQLTTAGQADTTGRFLAYAALSPEDRDRYPIATPDRRFPQGETSKEQANQRGLYFSYTDYLPFRPERGTYYNSHYRDHRHFEYYYNRLAGDVVEMSLAEMRLLKAEGLIRNGLPHAALPLINESRVGHGKLPPVTGSGPVPGGRACVPRMRNGACGNLMEALKWEKRLETAQTHLGAWFFDSRGWGDLEPGTPIHLPVPGRILQEMGLPIYTFGGTGGNCAAGGACFVER